MQVFEHVIKYISPVALKIKIENVELCTDAESSCLESTIVNVPQE